MFCISGITITCNKIPRSLLSLLRSVLLIKVYLITWKKIKDYLLFKGFFKFKKKLIIFFNDKKKKNQMQKWTSIVQINGKGKLRVGLYQERFSEFNFINVPLLTHYLAYIYVYIYIYIYIWVFAHLLIFFCIIKNYTIYFL